MHQSYAAICLISTRKVPRHGLDFRVTASLKSQCVWPKVKELQQKISQGKEKATELAADNTARICLAELNTAFKKQHGKDIRQVWAGQTSSGIEKTPTKNERRTLRREIEREVIKRVEEEYKTTDFVELYGSSSSNAQYERRRLNQGLASRNDEVSRMEERISGERPPTKVNLNYSAMTWDWQALVAEAKGWSDGRRVNWSDVARQYRVHQVADKEALAHNGGQIVQAVLVDAGIDVTQFYTAQGVQTGAPRARRAVRRSANGIAVPQHTPLRVLQEHAKEMDEDGTLIKAINIVPREFKQVIFSNDKQALSTRTKTIHGQKVNLHTMLEHFCDDKRHLLAATHFDPATMSANHIAQRLVQLGQVRLELCQKAVQSVSLNWPLMFCPTIQGSLDDISRNHLILNIYIKAPLSQPKSYIFFIILLHDSA